MINGFLSNKAHVKSGVPQGSVLGPLLFLILISDIDNDIVDSFLSSFADDTRVGKSVGSDDDVKNCKGTLTKFMHWPGIITCLLIIINLNFCAMEITLK